LLSKAGHRIDIAGNGREAVEAVQRGDYDAVLMDIQMPEVDGVQAARQIRALPSPKCTVPIIAVTAHALGGAKEEYIAAGMNDYVSKPIDPEILMAKLNALTFRPGAAEPDRGPAPAESPRDAGIDASRLDALAELMSPSEMAEIVQSFRQELTTRLRRMAQTRDLAALAADAHAIAGMSANMGADRVFEGARAIEAACETPAEIDAMTAALASLEAASDAAIRALDVWLASAGGRRYER
jgi:CheY-like chemotaxis protein/HPt (histidine-containing phosphotransfer) domain-containing protein